MSSPDADDDYIPELPHRDNEDRVIKRFTLSDMDTGSTKAHRKEAIRALRFYCFVARRLTREEREEFMGMLRAGYYKLSQTHERGPNGHCVWRNHRPFDPVEKYNHSTRVGWIALTAMFGPTKMKPYTEACLRKGCLPDFPIAPGKQSLFNKCNPLLKDANLDDEDPKWVVPRGTTPMQERIDEYNGQKRGVAPKRKRSDAADDEFRLEYGDAGRLSRTDSADTETSDSQIIREAVIDLIVERRFIALEERLATEKASQERRDTLAAEEQAYLRSQLDLCVHENEELRKELIRLQTLEPAKKQQTNRIVPLLAQDRFHDLQGAIGHLEDSQKELKKQQKKQQEELKQLSNSFEQFERKSARSEGSMKAFVSRYIAMSEEMMDED